MVKEQEKAIRVLCSNTYTYKNETYRIYSINRPGRLLKFLDLEGGRLFEAGRLLNFHHFQQVKYLYFATKQ